MAATSIEENLMKCSIKLLAVETSKHARSDARDSGIQVSQQVSYMFVTKEERHERERGRGGESKVNQRIIDIIFDSQFEHDSVFYINAKDRLLRY